MATRTVEISDLVAAVDERIAERQISASRAAGELGVAPQSISQWRRGANIKLTPALQVRLAVFLQTTPLHVAELFGLDVSDDVPTLYPFPDQRKEVVRRKATGPAEPHPCYPQNLALAS